jgi:hypothetical protein
MVYAAREGVAEITVANGGNMGAVGWHLLTFFSSHN